MSVFGDAINALRTALSLTSEFTTVDTTLKELCETTAAELQDHDCRLTRLEAQWEPSSNCLRHVVH